MVSLSSSSTLLAFAVLTTLLDFANAVEFFAPDWIIPTPIGTPYPAMTVNAGDSITFAWTMGTHDVWIYPSGTCDPTGGIQIATVSDNPTTYTFEEGDAGSTITFVCDVGAHCQQGMIMDVNILGSAGEDNENAGDASATQQPTGQFGTCYVCGSEDGQVSSPDEIVSLPNPGLPDFEVTCNQLFNDGINGVIPDDSCAFISNVARTTCGCTPLNLDPCNICGEDGFEVKAPEVLMALPTDPRQIPVRCGDLAASGLNGEFTADECSTVTTFAYNQCQCAPSNFTCSICGEGFEPTDPNAIVQGFGVNGAPSTCGELEASGASGDLSPGQCNAIESFMRFGNACACVPTEGYPVCNICGNNETMPLTPDVNLTLPFETNTCDFLYEAGKNGDLAPPRCAAVQVQAALGCSCAPVDYSCSVCGGDGTDMTMLNPETNFTVPGVNFLVNCGELDAAGVDGIITPNDCAIISPQVQANCGCAPTGFTCNICGADTGLVVTAGNATFVPNEALTCEDAQAAGLAGQIDPLRCNAISPFAQFACGCAESGSDGTAATSSNNEVSASDPAVTPVDGMAAPVATPAVGDTTEESATTTTTTTAADFLDPVVGENTGGDAADPVVTNEAVDEADADADADNDADADADADVDPEFVAGSGSAANLEGSGSMNISGSVTVSSSMSMTMALSCLCGMVVAILV